MQQYLQSITTDVVRLQDKKFAFEAILAGSQQNVQTVLDYVLSHTEEFAKA